MVSLALKVQTVDINEKVHISNTNLLALMDEFAPIRRFYLI